MLILILMLALALLPAFFLVQTLWPDRRWSGTSLPLRASLSIGLGLGISSLLFFLMLNICGSFSYVTLPLELIILGLFVFTAWKANARKQPIGAEKASLPVSATSGPFSKTLTVGFYIALGLAVVVFVLYTTKRPVGSWDGWATWNLKASYLHNSGAEWNLAFAYWELSDYPLLLPGIIARTWNAIGDKCLLLPPLTAFLFTFATLGLLVAALTCMRSKHHGYLAGLTLLGVPFFLENGSWQTADIPLSFFILATLVMFVLNDLQVENRGGFIALGGLAAGLACWTKNEGLLFLFALVAARFLVKFRPANIRGYIREVLLFTSGLMPAMIVVGLFKIRFAHENYILADQSYSAILEKLTDPTRYFMVIKYFFSEAFSLFNVSFLLFPILFFVFRTTGDKKYMESISTHLVMLFCICCGYCLVYVVIPVPLEYALLTGLKRLILQFTPGMIFLFFTVIATQEELLCVKTIKVT